jgi:phosphatidate cytidylyltransferase
MSNLFKRFLSALFLIPISLSFIFLAPGWLFSSFIVLLSAIIGYEYGTITLGPNFLSLRPVLSLFSATCCFTVSFSPLLPFSPFLPFSLVIFLVPTILMFFHSDFKDTVFISAFITSGSFYSGILIGLIALIFISFPLGKYLVFTLFLSAVLSDTFSYFVGRAFGRSKLAPRISPGKTKAGAIGGFLGVFLSLILCKFFVVPDFSFLDVILLSLPLSISLQLGDLAESFLKRGFSVKDSGTIIPGHGGILDRVDALLFGAPVVFLFSMLKYS